MCLGATNCCHLLFLLFITGLSMTHKCVHMALLSPKDPTVLPIDLSHPLHTQTFTHQHLSIRGLKLVMWHCPYNQPVLYVVFAQKLIKQPGPSIIVKFVVSWIFTNLKSTIYLPGECYIQKSPSSPCVFFVVVCSCVAWGNKPRFQHERQFATEAELLQH